MGEAPHLSPRLVAYIKIPELKQPPCFTWVAVKPGLWTGLDQNDNDHFLININIYPARACAARGKVIELVLLSFCKKKKKIEMA